VEGKGRKAKGEKRCGGKERMCESNLIPFTIVTSRPAQTFEMGNENKRMTELEDVDGNRFPTRGVGVGRNRERVECFRLRIWIRIVYRSWVGPRGFI
jgi:hypothetical protein